MGHVLADRCCALRSGVPGARSHRRKAAQGSLQGVPPLRQMLPPLDEANSLFSLTGAGRWQKPLGAICCHQADLLP